jgi:L-ribulokinase
VAIVAGVDFGTLSVRVTLLDSERARLATAVADYPLHRRRDDPDYAAQSHTDQMAGLVRATRDALTHAAISGDQVEAIALDTTGSSVIPVGRGLVPLDEYYLWCDHRAKAEAEEITMWAHRDGIEAIAWYGGVYSSEWGFAKLLHWLRHNSDRRQQLETAFEHCDMVAATLSGLTDHRQTVRSVCAMGHKWMWNPRWGGLPPESFLSKVDPLLQGVRGKLDGPCQTSDHLAGHLSPAWAEQLGLRAGIPIPVGAFDAHWDAIGAGIAEGDVVNVVGTSTCIIAIARETDLVPGVCGIVPGSVHPGYIGIEAGLSATGDIFDAISRRAGMPITQLTKGLEKYRAGETGLLRLTWDNGDRTVLVNPELGGVTLGWNLLHTPQDELFAAIEGTAFHTRIILDRLADHGVPIRRIINAGGVPHNSPVLNQVYANVLGRPVLVPNGVPTSLGSGIMALRAAGVFSTLEEAQRAMCLANAVCEPEPSAIATYEPLYQAYRRLYFAFGSKRAAAAEVGDVLPTLRTIAAAARRAPHHEAASG